MWVCGWKMTRGNNVIPARECSISKLIMIILSGMTNPDGQSLAAKRRSGLSGHWGGGPRVVVSTAAFHARVRGSVPGLGGLKETKLFLPHPRVKVSIVGSLRDREVACSASDRQGSNFESCVWRTVSSQSSHHPQEVLLAQFSLYVHKGGLKPDSFHFISLATGHTKLPRSWINVIDVDSTSHQRRVPSGWRHSASLWI